MTRPIIHKEAALQTCQLTETRTAERPVHSSPQKDLLVTPVLPLHLVFFLHSLPRSDRWEHNTRQCSILEMFVDALVSVRVQMKA